MVMTVVPCGNAAHLSFFQLDVEKHVSKPIFIPEKVDFKQLEKFEGAMLINWFSTAFDDDVYITQKLTADDLKVKSGCVIAWKER